MDWFFKFFFLILAYLIGSIPFGLLLAKAKHIDLKKIGSGNIGATNTGRALGKKYAFLTFLLDLIKGGLFVGLYRYNVLPSEWCLLTPMLYGLAATIGHAFPIYLKFHGGKCVSTGSGAIGVYAPILFAVGIAIFLVIALTTKLVSLASLICTSSVMVGSVVITLVSGQFMYVLGDTKFWPFNYWFMIITILICFLIFLRHFSNIKRLASGTEKPTDY